MSVTVAIEALREDSASWDRVASIARGAAGHASGLNLSAVHLSWASLETNLLDTYIEIQAMAVMLLDEAAQVYNDLSVGLDRIAYLYETNDEKAAKELKGVWDVREK